MLRSNFITLNEEDYSIKQENKKPIMKMNPEFISNLEEFEQKIADGGETTNFKELKSLNWEAKNGSIGRNVTFKGNITINEENSHIKDNEIIEE